MTLQNKIVYCRKKAGMSQEELSEVIGVSRQAISKWETGEATPEVSKLLLLSKTFGVTTDWLLSEDEPTADEAQAEEPKSEEDTPGDNPYYHKTSDERERMYPEWVDNLPHTLGRLLKRFGWLAGVYLALVGGGITLIGGIAKLVTSYMINGFSSTTDVMISEISGFGGAMYDPFLDQYNSAVNGMTDSFAKFNPVSVVANIMLFIGVILIIGGIILAVVLKKQSGEK